MMEGIDEMIERLERINNRISEFDHLADAIETAIIGLSSRDLIEQAQRTADGYRDEARSLAKSVEMPMPQPVIEWISVDDRLPDDDHDVLVVTETFRRNRPMVGYYDGAKWHAITATGYESNNVTHWAEMPKGPQ